MALHGSLLKEYVGVAEVGLDFAFYATSLSRVSLFGALDAASECVKKLRLVFVYSLSQTHVMFAISYSHLY